MLLITQIGRNPHEQCALSACRQREGSGDTLDRASVWLDTLEPSSRWPRRSAVGSRAHGGPRSLDLSTDSPDSPTPRRSRADHADPTDPPTAPRQIYQPGE